jgi:hypothetical protein
MDRKVKQVLFRGWYQWEGEGVGGECGRNIMYIGK